MYYFSKALMGNASNGRNLKAQYEFVMANRKLHAYQENQWVAGGLIQANQAAVIPRDVYQEFDSVAKEIMRSDEGTVLLNDLMPLARSLPVGKIVHKYRKSSDSGVTNTSISGLEPIANDQARYSYDGAIVPVHQGGFYREWRELEGMRSEGFDAMIDDQANQVRSVRRKMASYLLDGETGLEFDDIQSYGFRNAPGVAKADLANLYAAGSGIDFTSQAATGEDIRKAMIALLDILRIDNNVEGAVTVYVSREIESNFQRYYTTAANGTAAGTIMQQMGALAGVAAIKATSLLSGNEMLIGVLSQEYVMPLVGQAVSTVMMPRQTPFARHQGIVWSAMGLEIRTDYNGRTGWLYAS